MLALLGLCLLETKQRIEMCQLLYSVLQLAFFHSYECVERYDGNSASLLGVIRPPCCFLMKCYFENCVK